MTPREKLDRLVAEIRTRWDEAQHLVDGVAAQYPERRFPSVAELVFCWLQDREMADVFLGEVEPRLRELCPEIDRLYAEADALAAQLFVVGEVLSSLEETLWPDEVDAEEQKHRNQVQAEALPGPWRTTPLPPVPPPPPLILPDSPTCEGCGAERRFCGCWSPEKDARQRRSW